MEAECKRQRWGGNRGERREIRVVIQAGLKDELLKFGLIPPNLCFVPVFSVTSIDLCVCVCLCVGHKKTHLKVSSIYSGTSRKTGCRASVLL